MNRNVKFLQNKSRLHSVLDLGQGRYEVISGESDETYNVYVNADDVKMTCTCKFGLYRKDHICSHKTAVISFRAEQQGYRVMLWKTTDDAELQHRRKGTLQGVSWTARKVDTSIQPTHAKDEPTTKPVKMPGFAVQIWWQDRKPEDTLDSIVLHGTTDEAYAQKDMKIAKPSSGWNFVDADGTLEAIRDYMDTKELQVISVDIIGYRWNGRKEWLYNLSIG